MLENEALATGGYVGGTVASPRPTVNGHFSASDQAVVGDLGILDISKGAPVRLLDFDSGSAIAQIKSASLPMFWEWMFGSSIFWQGNSGWFANIGRWTPDGGSIDFISFGSDPNQAALALGTDGTDMVWFEGHGMSPDAGPYVNATMDYWTSPYVDDPSQLQPRRLRSETPPATVGNPIAVRCGRAAYATQSGLRIVRLSDGWSWFVPNGKGWNWQDVLALTCTELFVQVTFSGPITTMARVAFDQLGPGIAPD